MTKLDGKEKITKLKKENQKYNYLDKRGTLKTRQDYIETSYIKGVKNQDGTQAIRPMTKEEIEWLSQFIAETEHGKFKTSSGLKAESKKLRSLKTDFRQAKKKADVPEMERLFKEVTAQYEVVKNLRDQSNSFYIEDSERHAIFNRDYDRRMDLYNNAKMNNDLILFDMNEYDKFSTEAVLDIETENILLDQMVYPVTKKKKKEF